MTLPSRASAIRFLSKAGCSKSVVDHCIVVSNLAAAIARACERRGIPVDIKLVEIASLLHDVGRSVTHDVRHGVLGGALARANGFDERIVSIIETHVGAGIPADEAEDIGLPRRDFMPKTIEEKIVAYADKLMKGKKRVEVDEVLEEFSKTLGAHHPALNRFRNLHREISTLTDSDRVGSSDSRKATER
jgi:uncharacterized protein